MVEPSASFQKNGPQSECIIINKINSSNVNDTQEKLIEIPDVSKNNKILFLIINKVRNKRIGHMV